MLYMIRRAILGGLALCATFSCTSMSTLSKTAYDSQQRADALAAEGNWEAAAEHKAAADQARLKMARIGNAWGSSSPRL
jgi:hypothetical protein